MARCGRIRAIRSYEKHMATHALLYERPHTRQNASNLLFPAIRPNIPICVPGAISSQSEKSRNICI